MENGPKKAEKLCKIFMADETEPKPNGLRINICYNADTSILRLQKFHDISEVFIYLRACAPIQQYCKISPQTDEDGDALNALSTWMHRKRLVGDCHYCVVV